MRIALLSALALGAALAGAMLAAGGAHAAELRLPVTADTSLQAYSPEQDLNSGGSPVIRIKGWQHFMLLKFEVPPALRTWRVDRARLYLHLASDRDMLWRVGLSTITADWAEGTGHSSKVEDGCTFRRARTPDGLWAGPGSDFTAVAFGNGGSFMAYATPHRIAGGWLEIDVDPLLVEAVAAGGSYGLCVSDEKGQTFCNNDVHSREQSGFAPYLVVDGAPAAGGAAPAVGDLRAEPYPASADLTHGAVRLTFTAPRPEAVSYALRATGPDGTAALPRWELPSPAPPGTPREILFRGRPDADYDFTLVAIGAGGAGASGTGGPGASEATVRCRTSPALARPAALPVAACEPAEEGTLTSGGLRVRAWTGIVKLDAVAGDTLEGVAPSRELRLDAARNEVLSLQLAVGAEPSQTGGSAGAALPRLRGVTVALSDLRGPGGATIPASAGRWFREWCVRADGRCWGEYAVPLRGRFDVPWAENAIPGQRWQPIACDLYVPKAAAPGEYRSDVVVRAAEPAAEVRVPVVLRVHRFTIPDRTGFEVDFNCYGPVGDTRDWPAYLARERAYYRACHDLRATLNPLPYSQSGHVYSGFAPGVAGTGADLQLTNWARYDEHYGPYLDGSAFTGYRAGVPITHMYLPLHENWPLPLADHYSVHVAETRYPQMIVEHARLAGPIEDCLDAGYKAAFEAAARQFAEHLADRGWVHTDFQCYLNNKQFFRDPAQGGRGDSWWCLDEPMCTDDFLALRFFGRLFKAGVAEAEEADRAAGRTPARLIFRGDISRPEWQRHFLDGLTGLECVSDALWPYHDRLMDMQRRWGVRFWDYGSPNPVGASDIATVAWALRAYLAGADGILPWNVIGGTGALAKPTDTALLVPGDRFGVKGPVVSMRAKAFRRGQQDVELLIGLARRRGWNRQQTGAAVARLLPSWAVAGGWDKLRAADLDRVHLALYRALDQQ